VRAHDSKYTVTCHRLSCAMKGIKNCFDHFALHCAILRMNPEDTAKRRCECVHSRFLAIDRAVPGLAANVCFYMQCHLPAMAPGMTVQQVYAANLDPESSELAANNSYPSNRGCAAAAKGWHAQHCDDATDALSKLVRKGGPAPSSVRYVGGLLKRCTLGSSETQTIVRDMIASCLLGGYRHSVHTPPWGMHKDLLALTTEQMVDRCLREKTNKQLHHMAAEYVSANTLEHPALLWSVRKVAEAHAHGVAGGHLKLFGKHTAHSLPTTYSIFVTMARALNVNGSIPPPRCKHSAQTSASVRRGMVAPTQRQLQTIGASPEEIAAIKMCFSNDNSFSLKAMRMRLKGITPDVRAFLKEHVWTCTQSTRIQSVPFPEHVRLAQQKASAMAKSTCSKYLQFCLSCLTPRSAVLGLRLNRSTAGTTVNIETGQTVCNKCGESNVIVINMEGRLLTLLPQRFDKRGSTPVCIAVCCCCARQCVYTVPHGCYPVCNECLPRLRAAQVSNTSCLCGAAVGPNTMWTIVTGIAGTTETVALCRAHAHLAPDHVVSLECLQGVVSRACLRRADA